MMRPVYLATHAAGELWPRVDEALRSLAACSVCPRECGVDRLADEEKVCHVGRRARVASYFPHHGEEDCLRGRGGSGTIFFSFCNLQCAFCQNWETSHVGEGEEVEAQELAQMMLALQARGCHNVNFVTPEHVVPQILEALPYAIEGGLEIPLVYNTSAYDSLASLRLLDGIIDIYMPDFKLWSDGLSSRLLKARDYPERARAAITEMHRQVGDLVIDETGIARRGLLVRHLVMPEALAETERIVAWLARLSRDTYVNIMDQYRPAGRVLREPERFTSIARSLSAADYRAALKAAERVGLRRLDGRAPARHLTR